MRLEGVHQVKVLSSSWKFAALSTADRQFRAVVWSSGITVTGDGRGDEVGNRSDFQRSFTQSASCGRFRHIEASCQRVQVMTCDQQFKVIVIDGTQHIVTVPAQEVHQFYEDVANCS